MKFTREQARNLSGGGNPYFKLEEGKSALIRFLYNTLEDMEPMICHSITPPGNKYPVSVLCARDSENSPLSDCKYCQDGHKLVARYIIPIWNEDAQQIQYWERTGKFEEKIAVHTEDFNGQAPISGQVFKIIRTGSGTGTDYELIRQGVNDGKTKDAFGEVKSNDELHMIKPGNYEFPPQDTFAQNTQYNFNNNQQGNSQFNSTRRTTSMF